MAQRTKKKRNKVYRGQDAAAPDKPVVHRYTAVQRSKIGQWWFEKKRFWKPAIITAIVAAVIIWLIIELLRIIL
jgi:hypothetical protein